MNEPDGSLVTTNRQDGRRASFGELLMAPRLPELVKLLPDEQSAISFARIVETAINKTPDLKKCTPESILGCVFDLAAINLRPNTPEGHCYLIPYGDKCTVQLGYRGFAELAYRTGEVKMVQADVVRDGDDFDYSKGAGIAQYVKHRKQIGAGRGHLELLAAWASVELLNGGIAIEVMDADELAKIRRLANARKPSPAWKEFEDEMLKKSVVKRLLKLLQIGNMDTVKRAIEIDNRDSNVLPGIDVPAKSEHKLLFRDEPSESATEGKQ